MSELHAIESGEQRHLLTTSITSENRPSAPEDGEPTEDTTNQARFTIPRKPLPRHVYNVVPTGPEDVAGPKIDRKLLVWRPFYLRLPVLCTFVLFFCLLIVALETTYQVSRKSQGLVSSNQNLHYLWTYGPSAVLIVTAAFWGRVEYQLKELTPWHSMVGNGAEAKKSVLLDYVSPFLPVSIYTAFRRGHYTVASVAICGLLLRVLIVFSTALLILIPVQKSYENVPFVLTTALKGSSNDLNRTGLFPFVMLSGIAQQGLQYPFGVTPDLAYQTFNSSPSHKGSELHAAVASLEGDLECEKAQLTINSWWGSVRYGDQPGLASGISGSMNFTTSGCSISDVLIDTVAKSFYQKIGNQSTDYVAIYRPGYCGTSTSDEDGRIVIAAGAVQLGLSQNSSIFYTNTTVGNKTYQNVPYYFRNTNFTMKTSTQFICRPKIAFGTARVSVNRSQVATAMVQSMPMSDTAVPETSNLSGWDYVQTQWNALNRHALSPTNERPQSGTTSQFLNSSIDLPEVDAELLLGIIQTGLPFNTTAEFLQDANLVGAAQKYFKALTALYTHLSISQSQSVPANGTVELIENRLQVKELSVRVMEGILALIVVLTIQIIVYARRLYAVPRNPSTMISFAALLHPSRGFMTLLKGSGFIPTSRFESRLADQRFTSGVASINNDTPFYIQVGHKKQSEIQKSSRHKKNANECHKSWRPFIISFWGRACACVVLLLIIVVLEILLALSHKNQGLSDASYHGSIHYVWAYVPATIFVLLSLWFSAIDFDIRCLGPYFDLRKGAPAFRSIGLSYLDGLSTTTLAKAMRRHHLMVFVTAFAAIIASNFTIAVSGLYVISAEPKNFTIQLQAESMFTSDSGLPGLPNDSATTADLVLFANLSSPAWTYEELAFPRLSIAAWNTSANAGVQSDEDARIKTRVTATRSNLACQIYGKDNMTVNITNTDNGYKYFFNVSLPNALRGMDTWGYTEANDDTYVGYSQCRGDSECSPIFYIWGHIKNAQEYSLTAMFCNETLNDIDTDITLVGPSMTISDSEPPSEIGSTLRLSNASKSDDAVNDLSGIGTPSNVIFTGLFVAVVYGKDGIPIEDLGDSQHQLKVVDRIKRVNSLTQAQYLGRQIRVPLNATTKPPPFNATYIQMNRLRLVQDAVATRVLDGLLAVALICTTIALFTGDTRDVVPRNPCSIAAKASILADSSLVTSKVLPQDCQQMSDQELEAHVKDMRFRMGWFENEDSGRVYKLDVVEPGEELARLTERPKER